MEPFLERLIAERDELQERMTKLDAFIGTDKFGALSSENRALLEIQLDAMKTYKDILNRRINLNA